MLVDTLSVSISEIEIEKINKIYWLENKKYSEEWFFLIFITILYLNTCIFMQDNDCTVTFSIFVGCVLT